MTAPMPASLWHFLSREVALVCDASGTLTWMDERAARLLEAVPGQRLHTLAAQGTEEKVDRLVTLARDERVERWEVILCVGGMPRTFSFRGAPHEGGAALVGSLVPEDYAASLSQVSETMSELAALHRETERQQRELKRRADELARINRELEESNRGVRTLHAELDEKTESLRAGRGNQEPRGGQREPRVPHPAALHPRPGAAAAQPRQRRAHRRAAEAGAVHPHLGRGPLRAGERPAGPLEDGVRQGDAAAGALQRHRTSWARCAG